MVMFILYYLYSNINVPAGTYYAGVHSWNRTASENDNKVFSKWSNLETAKVK